MRFSGARWAQTSKVTELQSIGLLASVPAGPADNRWTQALAQDMYSHGSYCGDS